MPELAAQWNAPADRRLPDPLVYAAITALAVAVAAGTLLELWVQTLLVLVGISFLLAVLIRPLVGLLAWLVTAPVLNYYVHVRLPVGVPDITFQRLVIGLLLLVVLAPVILGRKPFPRIGATEKAMLVFSVLGFISCFFGAPPVHRNVELFLRAYCMPFLIFFTTTHLVRSDRDLRLALWLIVPQAVYLALLGIYQRFTGTLLLVPASAELQSTYLLLVGRATGPFANSVEFGIVVAIGLVVMIVLLAHRRHDAHAVLLWAVIPIAALGIFYSYTRAVWLGLALALAGLYFWVPRMRRMLGVGTLLGGLGALVSVPLFLADPLFLSRLSATNPITGRLLMYPTVVRMAMAKPLFGYGFAPTTFSQARGEFFDTFAGIGISTARALNPPHNEMLHVLVLTGFVGLAAYVAVYVGVWRDGRRLAALTEPSDAFGRGFLGIYRAVFVIVAVNMLFIDLVFLTYLTGFVFFFFGLMQARLRMRQAAQLAPGARGDAGAADG